MADVIFNCRYLKLVNNLSDFFARLREQKNFKTQFSTIVMDVYY